MPEKISENDVRHVAKLSRLHLNDEQVHHFTEQLASVLSYIDKLSELDVEGVEPMAHAFEQQNVFRADEPKPGRPAEEMIANAPEQDPPFFKVPKVLGDTPGA